MISPGETRKSAIWEWKRITIIEDEIKLISDFLKRREIWIGVRNEMRIRDFDRKERAKFEYLFRNWRADQSTSSGGSQAGLIQLIIISTIITNPSTPELQFSQSILSQNWIAEGLNWINCIELIIKNW
jgi:hypothetical protein